MDDISLARSNSGPWQPGSLLQRVVEREAAVDADHTDVDSMPDLVTVQGRGCLAPLLRPIAWILCPAKMIERCRG